MDALSDDGRFGLSLIAFVGSVFSPYYAFARRRACPDPENHVALNVAIYGADGYRWAMTERGRSALRRDARSLVIGPSQLTWIQDGSLTIEFDEVALPLPRRVRGRVSIRPMALASRTFSLDRLGRHQWQPIAPHARIDVTLDSPRRNWTGSAYIDHNWGSEPLSAAFRSWNWSRTIEPHCTRLFYDIVERDGATSHLRLIYDAAAQTPRQPSTSPPLVPLQRTLWRLERAARSDPDAPARLIEAWEDGPFYARALIEQTLDGHPVRAVHEALSLDRFRRGIVQAMLPFRMPRLR